MQSRDDRHKFWIFFVENTSKTCCINSHDAYNYKLATKGGKMSRVFSFVSFGMKCKVNTSETSK
jgi:hypothetical protein